MPFDEAWDIHLGLGSDHILTRLKLEGSILKVPVNPEFFMTPIFCILEDDPTSERAMSDLCHSCLC